MNKKIIVKEDTVRRWISKLLNETGTVPQGGAPIKASRRHVAEADDEDFEPKTKLRPYRGKEEERPERKHAKKKGAEGEDVRDIASAMGWKDPYRPEQKPEEWRHGKEGISWKLGKNPATDAPIIRIRDPLTGKTYQIDPAEQPDYPHHDVYGRPIKWQVSPAQVKDIYDQAVDRLQLAMGHPGEATEKGYVDPEQSRLETQNPDLVMQVMEFAVEEYKEHLEFPARMIKYCIQKFYVPDLKKGVDRFNLGAGEEEPGDDAGDEDEDLGISAEEEGSASFAARIAATPRFQQYFSKWLLAMHGIPKTDAAAKQLMAKDPSKLASFELAARQFLKPMGGKVPKGIENIQHYLGQSPGGPGAGKGEKRGSNQPWSRELPVEGKTFWFRSVFNLADRIGTIDVYNPELGNINAGLRLGLDLSYQPELTKVDQALIFEDDGFKYFVAGQGGVKVHYLDWLRNAAEELDRYKGEF